MTVHITTTRSAGETVLKVDGWLFDEDTASLVEALRDCPGDTTLDLSELRLAGRDGVRILRELRDRGARLSGLRPLLAMLLAGEAGHTP